MVGSHIRMICIGNQTGSGADVQIGGRGRCRERQWAGGEAESATVLNKKGQRHGAGW